MRDRPDFYDFNGIRLFLVESHIEVLDTGKEHTPSPIHRRFLLALVKKAPNMVSYKELWRDVWRSKHDMSDTDLRNIQTTKGSLSNWLKSIGVKDSLIEAETSKGYRLNCEIVSGWLESEPKVMKIAKDLSAQTENINAANEESKSENWQEILKFHKSYIIPASFFYGLLFLIAAIIEVAYEFDVYGGVAAVWGLILMLINGAAFLSACVVSSYRLYYKRNSFLLAIGILLGAVFISVLVSIQFLPFRPVTQAAFQTQPAFVAFGKNALGYFLPLSIIFLLLPFYTVIARYLVKWRVIEKSPSDTVSIKPRWLLVICAGALIFSVLTTNYMLDNLNAESEYHALFVGMIFLRLIIYFGLALSSIAWYHTQIKRKHR